MSILLSMTLPSISLVTLGDAGNFATTKLIPASPDLCMADTLPKKFYVGVSRRMLSLGKYPVFIRESRETPSYSGKEVAEKRNKFGSPDVVIRE